MHRGAQLRADFLLELGVAQTAEVMQIADLVGRDSLVAVLPTEDVEHRVKVDSDHVVRHDDALWLVIDGNRRFPVLLHIQIRRYLVAVVVCAVVVLEVPGG